MNTPTGTRPTQPNPNDPAAAKVVRQLAETVKYLWAEVVRLKETVNTMRATIEKHDQVING